MEAPDLPAGGTTIPISYHGNAGEEVSLLVSLAPDFEYRPNLRAVLLEKQPYRILPQGTLDSFGALSAPFFVPNVPPGLENFTIYLQASMKTLPNERVLSNPSILSVSR